MRLIALLFTCAALVGFCTRADAARVVCFGDSITHAGYPHELQPLVGGEVVNAGVPGNTTRNGLRRIERDVLDRKPGAVVILFGTNDCRLDDPKVYVPVGQYEKNLTEIVTRCRQAGAKVVICTLPPIDPAAYFKRHAKQKFDAAGGLEHVLSEYRAAAIKVAREQKTGLLELHQLLTKDPGWMSSDGVHPTPEGNRIIARHVADVLKPLIAEAPAR